MLSSYWLIKKMKSLLSLVEKKFPTDKSRPWSAICIQQDPRPWSLLLLAVWPGLRGAGVSTWWYYTTVVGNIYTRDNLTTVINQVDIDILWNIVAGENINY